MGELNALELRALFAVFHFSILFFFFFFFFVSLEHKSELKCFFLNPDSFNYSPGESKHCPNFTSCPVWVRSPRACYLNTQRSVDGITILFSIKLRRCEEQRRGVWPLLLFFLPARRTSSRTQRLALEIHCKAGQVRTRTSPNLSFLRSVQVKVLIVGEWSGCTPSGYLDLCWIPQLRGNHIPPLLPTSQSLRVVKWIKSKCHTLVRRAPHTFPLLSPMPYSLLCNLQKQLWPHRPSPVIQIHPVLFRQVPLLGHLTLTPCPLSFKVSIQIYTYRLFPDSGTTCYSSYVLACSLSHPALSFFIASLCGVHKHVQDSNMCTTHAHAHTLTWQVSFPTTAPVTRRVPSAIQIFV